MKQRDVLFPLFAVALLAMGCSSPKVPTTADVMRGHAEASQANLELKSKLAKEWENGNKLLKSGDKLIKKGEEQQKKAESQLKEARSMVEKGNKEVEEGRKMMQQSETKFKEAFPGLNLK